MSEIHLPHVSWFSYKLVPASYQHKGLAQQVLAHKAASLNKTLQGLLNEHQSQIDGILALRKIQLELSNKINTIKDNSKSKSKLKNDLKCLTQHIKVEEKKLLGSTITIEISKLRFELKKISCQLRLPI